MQYSILNDKAFKEIFTGKHGERFLKSLVNSFLRQSGIREVATIEEIKNEIVPDGIAEKAVYLDVVAKDVDGRIINIEVQNNRQTFYLDRTLYYWAKLLVHQIKKGERYDNLRPVICINLLDYNHFKDDRWCRLYQIEGSNLQNIIISEMPKLEKELSGLLLNLENDIKFIETAQMWGLFLHFAGRDNKKISKLVSKVSVFEEVKTEFERIMSIDAKFVREMHKEMAEKDLPFVLEMAKKEGLEQGEQKAKLETAKAMKAENFAPQVISKLTGLSLEIIEKL